MTQEQFIQSTIIKKLEKQGWIVVKNTVTSYPGWPDLTAYKDGHAVFIEVKKPGENAYKRQAMIHNKLRKAGFIVMLLDDHRSELIAPLDAIIESRKTLPI